MHECIRYRIEPVDPGAHIFEVRCTVARSDPAGQAFRLPSWVPGSYLIREFARHFVRVTAADASGAPVAIAKQAKDLWRTEPTDGPVSVTAHVYAFDVSVRAAYLDGTRGFFNGTSVFLCPEGFADAPCEVEIVRPRGDAFAQWRVATSMRRLDAEEFGFGSYGAANYEELVDHPVELGDFSLASFDAGGARHHVALTGRHGADMPRLAADLQRVCAWQCSLFDEAGKAPFDRYVFLVTAVGEGYGGLEHRASTSLICRRDELPRAGVAAVTEDYRTLLGLASHEYFHSWHVKRIRPAALTPYDLTREGYTRLLWAFEGITSYYDDLALVRSGVIDIDAYLELLGRTITSVLRTPGRHLQSIAESSFDAWIKFYRPDENTPNAVVSYYAKGALVALALDLTLRKHGSSLDALMRALWRQFGCTGTGVPEDAIPRMAEELAGTSLDEFFARYVEGTEDPPLSELLLDFGMLLHFRPQEGTSDPGGKPAASSSEKRPRAWLGVKLASASEPRLQYVFHAGPAERAGLAGGDVLVALDGLRASADALDKLGRNGTPGDAVQVVAFRRDELMQFTCVLDPAPDDTAWLTVDDDAGADAFARRTAWLAKATVSRLD